MSHAWLPPFTVKAFQHVQHTVWDRFVVIFVNKFALHSFDSAYRCNVSPIVLQRERHAPRLPHQVLWVSAQAESVSVFRMAVPLRLPSPTFH